MKKLLFTAFMMMSITSFSQTINDIPLKELDVKYLQIVGTSKLMSNKLTISIDIGQHVKFFQMHDKNIVLKDENGERMEFNSMIDALNFMSKSGYEYKDAYVLSTGSGLVYHYVLEKK